jgi:Uma2 family endonuclease
MLFANEITEQIAAFFRQTCGQAADPLARAPAPNAPMPHARGHATLISMLDPQEIAPERPRPIRREEYERMVALGLFEDERVELLYGLLISMSPHGPEHDSTIDRLNLLLVRALGDRARVRIQGSFAASDDSEPEPDVAVLPPIDYDDAHPREAWLVIEVAESSLAKDRGPKARLYAASNVSEYWVVNLVDHAIEVHTNPRHGVYETKRQVRRGDRITLVRFPDVELRVDDILRQ